jgi:hypothetical protein
MLSNRLPALINIRRLHLFLAPDSSTDLFLINPETAEKYRTANDCY